MLKRYCNKCSKQLTGDYVKIRLDYFITKEGKQRDMAGYVDLCTDCADWVKEIATEDEDHVEGI